MAGGNDKCDEELKDKKVRSDCNAKTALMGIRFDLPADSNQGYNSHNKNKLFFKKKLKEPDRKLEIEMTLSRMRFMSCQP